MITILFEDKDVVVIDKPAGMLVHEGEGDAGGKNKSDTVAEWFRAYVPEAEGVGEPGKLQSGEAIERSGLVHRLDRETSGVMILAKNQDAFLHLKQQFHDHEVTKEYRAFVHGKVENAWGTVDRPIGRSNKDFRLRSAQRGARGMLRPAVTDWELIKTGEAHAYLKVFPKTGRTHQIRVHLKAINRPIVCDALYAPNHPCDLGFGRLALHAYGLEIGLPESGRQRFEASLPVVFLEAERKLG